MYDWVITQSSMQSPDEREAVLVTMALEQAPCSVVSLNRVRGPGELLDRPIHGNMAEALRERAPGLREEAGR